jgi:hypothetical protein
VSFHTADETQWNAATLNYPVTSGNSFWTEPNAGADIDVGATRLVMAPQTELDVTALDDHTMAATEAQGELFMRIRNLAQGESFTITTPRAVVTLAAAGHYDVIAGDTEHPTLITVIDGSAQINGTNISLQLTSHQAATVTGTETFQATVGAENDDAFIRAQLGRDKPPVPRVTTPSPQGGPSVESAAPPAIVAEMTGGDELEETGQWAPTQEYGTVWYPPVERDWVPYRHGHWAYVAPWGWTWVDQASWGFAPSHYGRWVEIDHRWGWTPGVEREGVGGYPERPVYAPAVVSFVGVAAGAALGAAAGFALGSSVGWVPLGPREPYIPPYRVSNQYLTRVNVTNVTNITTITNIQNNPPPVSQFVNQRAATVVPGTAMASSQPIAQRVQPLPENFAASRPIERAPIAPTAATVGVTPAVARQFNIPPAPAGAVPARPVAPGPAVQPRPADFGHGPLRPTGNEPAPGAPAAGVVPPGAGPSPESARPGISPGAAVLGGAALGGAALGGAALLNRQQPAAAVPPAPGAPTPGAPAPGARPTLLPPGNGPRTPGAPVVPRAGAPGVTPTPNAQAARPGAPEGAATPATPTPATPTAPAPGGAATPFNRQAAPGAPAVAPPGARPSGLPALNGTRTPGAPVPPVPGAPAATPPPNPGIARPGTPPNANPPNTQTPGAPIPPAAGSPAAAPRPITEVARPGAPPAAGTTGQQSPNGARPPGSPTAPPSLTAPRPGVPVQAAPGATPQPPRPQGQVAPAAPRPVASRPVTPTPQAVPNVAPPPRPAPAAIVPPRPAPAAAPVPPPMPRIETPHPVAPPPPRPEAAPPPRPAAPPPQARPAEPPHPAPPPAPHPAPPPQPHPAPAPARPNGQKPQ